MQFEVATHRMAAEFSAPISLEPLPYTVARAVDPADAELLAKQASVEVFTRTDGVTLAVFSTKWRLENIERDLPSVRLSSLVAAGD
jgi:peptide chain release factor 3